MTTSFFFLPRLLSVAALACALSAGANAGTVSTDKVLASAMAGTAVPALGMLVMQHGLPHDFHDEKYFNTFFADRRPLPQQRYDYIAHALTDKPVNAPGSKFSYSNSGFMISAVIAERATGISYETLMRREVFDPLWHEERRVRRDAGRPTRKGTIRAKWPI